MRDMAEETFPDDELDVRIERRAVEALVNLGVTVSLIPDKTCLNCGRTFTPIYMIGATQLWCGGKCASETRRKRRETAADQGVTPLVSQTGASLRSRRPASDGT